METQQYRALIQERADLVNEAGALFAAAERENRALTADEKARDDEIAARLAVINDDIGRIERQRERERQALGQGAPTQITGVRDRIEDDPKRGFVSLADFAVAVYHAHVPGGAVDERLRYQASPSNYHRETGSSDGYMLPPQFRQEIYDLVFNGQDILGLVTIEPTNANTIEFLADESTPWGAAGIQANWRAEGTQMTPSRLATEPRQMRIHELYAFVLATEELLADGPRINARLSSGSAAAIRWKASESLVTGTGAGMPLGWLNSPALVEVAKESNQTNQTIKAENVLKMYSRHILGPRSFWLVTGDAIPQLATMTIGQQPIWLPPNGLVGAPGGTLLGLPVHISEHAEQLGAVGDIQLINPDGYYAAQRSGIDAASSMHLYFDYAITAFRWMFRLGGMPYLSEPVTPAKNSSTRSHFVTLAKRAA